MYVYWVYMYMCMYMYVFVSRVNTYLQIDTHDYQCIYVRIPSIYVYVYVFVSCVYTYLHLTFRTEVLHCMRAVGTCVWHDSLCDLTHDSWLMTHDSWLTHRSHYAVCTLLVGCNNGGGGGNFSKVKRLVRKCKVTLKPFFSCLCFFLAPPVWDFRNAGTFS